MAKQDRNNLRITLLLYSFILNSNLCRGSTFAEDRRSIHPIETLESKVYPQTHRPEKVSTSPDIISSHAVYTTNTSLSPNEKVATLPDIVGSHTGKIPDTPLNLEEGVVALPDVVTSSHIDSNSNSPATKPIVIPPIKTDPETVLDVVAATLTSCDVAQALEKKWKTLLDQEFGLKDPLEEHLVRTKYIVKKLSEIIQYAGERIADIDKNVAPLVTVRDLLLFVQNNKKTMLKHVNEYKKIVEKMTDFAENKAVEAAERALSASEFAIEQISSEASKVKVEVDNKEVTALEILIATKEENLDLLERGQETRKIIDDVAKQISEEMPKVEGIEKKIEMELNNLKNKHDTLSIKSDDEKALP